MKKDMQDTVVDIPLMTDRLAPGDSSTGPAAAISLLVQRAAAGDSTAFEQIMIYSQHRVISVAWRILGNQEDARDAAQEVFLRVFKHLRTFRVGEDFWGWLYRIVINVCRDIERKRRIRRDRVTSLDERGESENLPELIHQDQAEAAALMSQRREIVSKAIQTLSERERTALVLRDLEGLSTDEVAQLMGSRPSTVRVQINSARNKIKQYCSRFLSGTQKG